MCADRYVALRKLGALGEELERHRVPDPYPPCPSGPAPNLEQLRRRRDEIKRVAACHGARTVRVFGSVAGGDVGPASDVVLVEMGNRRSLLELAALPADLEDLLGCPVDVVTTGGLSHAREHTRDRIEHEADSL